MMIGLYVPGTSALHRCPAGAKLAALAVGVLALGIWRTWQVTLVGALLVLAGTALAGVGARAVIEQVKPVVWVAVAIAAFQVWASGWRHALVIVASLLVAVAAAGLVTLTTRTEDLIDALVAALRPLRRLGVDPDRVALTLALTVRAVPVLVGLVEDVREARRARGAERSPRALAVPVVVRTVRYADRLGEALAARGLDDD